jgi:asparagine synthase (glutamine-hydrolysing)
MPGLTITLNHDKCNYVNPIAEDFPNYKSQAFENKKFCISSFSPENYPIQYFENEHFKIILEGFIFSAKTSLENELFEIAQERFLSNKNHLLKQFIESTDGEYIVCIVEKSSHKLLLFNDYLARLPFYYYNTENEILLSREISFVVKNSKAKVNPIAKAEVMMLGFPLGNKTLHENCFRLLPSQCITVEGDNTLKLETLYSLKFDNQDKTISFDNAVQKYDAFCKCNLLSHLPRIYALKG